MQSKPLRLRIMGEFPDSARGWTPEPDADLDGIVNPGIDDIFEGALSQREREKFESDPDLKTLEGITEFVQRFSWPYEREAKVLEAIKNDRPEDYFHFREGALAFHREDFKAARHLLSALPHISPFIDYILAEAEFLQGNVAVALELYKSILERDKDNIPVLMSLSNVHASIGHVRDQVAVLDHVVEVKEDHHAALQARGFAYLQLKEYAPATADFRRAVEIVPSDVGACFGLARSLYCDEQYDDALEATLVAQQWDPQSAQIAFHLGLVYDAKEEYALAVEVYRNALCLCNGNHGQKAQVLWHLADDLLRMGEYDDAHHVGNDLVDMGEIEGHLIRAEALYGARDLFQAESNCRLYLERDPNSPAAWELLGKICEKQGKTHEAFKCFKRAAEEFTD